MLSDAGGMRRRCSMESAYLYQSRRQKEKYLTRWKENVSRRCKKLEAIKLSLAGSIDRLYTYQPSILTALTAQHNACVVPDR